MNESYLEVTFHHGRPMAAYYYLPRRPGQKSYRTGKAEAGLLIDYSRGVRPIGIESTAPSKVTLAAVNRVLKGLGFAPVKREELAPLLAA